ncbi:MAG: hypothetical protein Q8Q24_00140 [bacterium]|nr:hypothetical protein [bacterium]
MEKEENKKLIKKVWEVVSHNVIILLLLLTFLPAAKWYYETKPLVGTDFYLATTYVNYLSEHFNLRPFSWKYIWSAGYPLAKDYPTLHIYFILPLTHFFSPVQAVQIYMLFSTFMFGLFAYFLFYEISRSKWFSLALAVGSFYSVGYYGSLIWGGGLPYYATQPFLPLVLWLLVRHFNNQKEGRRDRKNLILAGFFAGLSFLAHPQAPAVSIVPMGVLFILFWHDKHTPLFSKQKLIDLFVFLFICTLTGLPFIKPYFPLLATMIFHVVQTGERSISATSDSQYNLQWELGQLSRITGDTSPIVWPPILVGSAVLLLGILLGRKFPKKIWVIIPFGLSALFFYFNLLTWAYRLNPLQGGWYRAFWPFPLLFGGLAASLWGAGSELLSKRKLGSLFTAVLGLFFTAGLVTYGFFLLVGFYNSMGLNSNPSSAFPSNINLAQTKDEMKELKKKLLPDWFEGDNKNYRMFTIDVAHNISWNTYFDLPLAQGYVDPPIPFVGRGYLYLTDITLAKDELAKRFDYTPEQAKEIAKFIIDWSAIRYFEGGYTPGRHTVAPISNYIKDLVARDKEMTFEKVLVYRDTQMPIAYYNTTGTHYYEFKPELTSPILSGNVSPTLAVVGKFGAIDSLSRTLATKNLNSRYLVPIIGPEKIDGWSLSDYKKFDAVFLYNYDYDDHNKSWAMIDQYVKQGGKLLVDTGGDTKETASVKLPDRFPKELPDLFPVRKTDKEYINEQWDFAPGESNLTDGIAFTDFGPAKLDGEDWGVSYAEKSDVDPDAQVILYDHGKVVMAEKNYGKGKVIWSGLNLPYHTEYYKKTTERDFLVALLGGVIPLEEKIAPASKVDWISPEKRQVVADPGTKGILFKEYDFDGWHARLNSSKGSQEAKVYAAGPAYPGYMYVPIPPNWRDSQVTAVFYFKGKVEDWLLEFLPFISGLIVLDFVFFNKKVFLVRFKGLLSKFSFKTSGWWEKEE